MGRTQRTQCWCAVSAMADANDPRADAKNPVIPTMDAKPGFSLTPPYVQYVHAVTQSPKDRFITPFCVRQGKKQDRDWVFASAICVRLASARTQLASANRLTMRPS